MMMKENAASLTGNDRFEGYLADILRLVASRLRFDYEICLSTYGNYGEQNANGQWNGIIGEVVRGVSTALQDNGAFDGQNNCIRVIMMLIIVTGLLGL